MNEPPTKMQWATLLKYTPFALLFVSTCSTLSSYMYWGVFGIDIFDIIPATQIVSTSLEELVTTGAAATMVTTLSYFVLFTLVKVFTPPILTPNTSPSPSIVKTRMRRINFGFICISISLILFLLIFVSYASVSNRDLIDSLSRIYAIFTGALILSSSFWFIRNHVVDQTKKAYKLKRLTFLALQTAVLFFISVIFISIKSAASEKYGIRYTSLTPNPCDLRLLKKIDNQYFLFDPIKRVVVIKKNNDMKEIELHANNLPCKPATQQKDQAAP